MVPIDRLLEQLQKYVSTGDKFVRNSDGGRLNALIISLQRRGIDAKKTTRDILPELRRLHRDVRHLKRMWLTMALRMIGVIASAIVVRLLLLSWAPQDSLERWSDIGTPCLLASLLCMGFICIWSSHRYLIFGWGRSKELRLWDAVVGWLSMGRLSSDWTEYSPAIKKFLHDEMRTGVDSTCAREAFLRARLEAVGEEVSGELEALGLVSTALELSAFLAGHIGLSLVPFLAWFESVSGVD